MATSANAAFRERLDFGRVAESAIAQWLIANGRMVLPIYEVEVGTGKGPRLFTRDREIVAPDLLVMGGQGVTWIEAKHKTTFTWYRKTARWTTGIDLQHYLEYQEIARRIVWPVWLLFLHDSDCPAASDLSHGCPPLSPTGLFGESLEVLSQNESHRSMRWGTSGMVYWEESSLRLLATLESVNAILRP